MSVEDQYEIEVDAVVNNIDWVNKVLVAGVLLSCSVVAIKMLGGTEVKIDQLNDVAISVADFWIVALVGTICHIYAAILLIKSVSRLRQTESKESCAQAFRKIRANGGVFVRGMTHRRMAPSLLLKGGVRSLLANDPSYWLTLCSAVIVYGAIIPFKYFFSVGRIPNLWLYVLVAWTVVIVNYIVGSKWAVEISSLQLKGE